MKNVAFIGLASGWGAQVRETEKGPSALKDSDILSTLPFVWSWMEVLRPSKTAAEIHLPSGEETLPYIQDVCVRLAHSAEHALQTGQFPVVIGGDHSIAVGTWTGITHYFNAKGKFGLIWIDAHMDAHTMDTTPSKAYHGMPLAALLGFGEPSLVNLLGEEGAVLNPAHVCLIGIRSYEAGEEALLKRLGVRVYYMEEVEERGFAAVFQEALQYVKQGTEGFGLSIDLDGFDPSEAPGVGTPASHGLKAAEVLPALSVVRQDPLFKALEVVEYNPDRDEKGKTLILLKEILEYTL
jgi:arginase